MKTVLRTWLWLEQSLLLIMCNWKQENMRNEDTGRCIVMNLPEMLKFPNMPTHFSLVVTASVSTQGVTQWSTRVLLSCFRHGWEKKGVLLYYCGQIWVGRQGKKRKRKITNVFSKTADRKEINVNILECLMWSLHFKSWNAKIFSFHYIILSPTLLWFLVADKLCRMTKNLCKERGVGGIFLVDSCSSVVLSMQTWENFSTASDVFLTFRVNFLLLLAGWSWIFSASFLSQALLTKKGINLHQGKQNIGFWLLMLSNHGSQVALSDFWTFKMIVKCTY